MRHMTDDAAHNPAPGPRFRSVRVVMALIIREMHTRYGTTWGGYVWAILEPVGMIALLSIAFSQFIRTPPLGSSFVLFYATGYIPFHFYAEVAGNTSLAITTNRPLLHFPAVNPLDAVLARFILSILTLIVVTVVTMTGIYLIEEITIQIDLGPVLLSLAAAACLGLGVGTLNCVLFPFLPVWHRIWVIINRPLFLISGIFFTYESMPANVRSILWWNPIVHTVGESRSGYFPIYDGTYVSMLYVWSIAIGSFLLGAYLLRRHKTYIIEKKF